MKPDVCILEPNMVRRHWPQSSASFGTLFLSSSLHPSFNSATATHNRPDWIDREQDYALVHLASHYARRLILFGTVNASRIDVLSDLPYSRKPSLAYGNGSNASTYAFECAHQSSNFAEDEKRAFDMYSDES